MAREHFVRSLRTGEGTLQVGSTIRLLEPGSTDLIPEPVYDTLEGATPRENPWVTPDGVVDFYLDRPRAVRIGVTPPGAAEETFFEDVPVGDEEVYKETFSFTVAGPVSPSVGSLRFYVEDTSEILLVRVSCGVSPGGGDVVVDLNVNGSTVFIDQGLRPRVVAGQNTGTSVPTQTALAAGDYLTVDIDEVGVTTPGAELVVQVRTRRLG